jgi:hypothetical protein
VINYFFCLAGFTEVALYFSLGGSILLQVVGDLLRYDPTSCVRESVWFFCFWQQFGF